MKRLLTIILAAMSILVYSCGDDSPTRPSFNIKTLIGSTWAGSSGDIDNDTYIEFELKILNSQSASVSGKFASLKHLSDFSYPKMWFDAKDGDMYLIFLEGDKPDDVLTSKDHRIMGLSIKQDGSIVADFSAFGALSRHDVPATKIK